MPVYYLIVYFINLLKHYPINTGSTNDHLFAIKFRINRKIHIQNKFYHPRKYSINAELDPLEQGNALQTNRS